MMIQTITAIYSISELEKNEANLFYEYCLNREPVHNDLETTMNNKNDVHNNDIQRSIEEFIQFFCANILLILTEYFNEFISS